MYKILIKTPDPMVTKEYLTTIVPVKGDSIGVNGNYYTVTKRTLFTENQNFVIIDVA